MHTTLNTVKQLSQYDKKSLTERTLKLSEEAGELAKAVLSYENCYATNHRFTTNTKVLEESVDTILCALSIAYKMGFTDSDITDMMDQKCVKWSRKQQASDIGQFPLPFEIHITIKHPGNEKIQSFKDSCSLLDVKPIILDLNNSTHDVMTSSTIITDNIGAYNYMHKIASTLADDGFSVIRCKIETVPWHPSTPTVLSEVKPHQYFESHINIVVNQTEKELLQEWNSQFNIGAHFSTNTLKQINNEYFVQMITLRSTTINNRYKEQVQLKQGFINYIEHVIELIRDSGIIKEDAILKHNIEYAVYDTYIGHDTAWTT
jgi:NTP pyrophosphatase (non-canonical NTP hydrolase)